MLRVPELDWRLLDEMSDDPGLVLALNVAAHHNTAVRADESNEPWEIVIHPNLGVEGRYAVDRLGVRVDPHVERP